MKKKAVIWEIWEDDGIIGLDVKQQRQQQKKEKNKGV